MSPITPYPPIHCGTAMQPHGNPIDIAQGIQWRWFCCRRCNTYDKVISFTDPTRPIHLLQSEFRKLTDSLGDRPDQG